MSTSSRAEAASALPRPVRVLVVGEALVDILVPAGQAGGASSGHGASSAQPSSPVEHVGGSPANVAAGLGRLDHPVDLSTCLGDDARGARIHAHLEARGVTVTADSTAPGGTSTATATIGSDGAATYTFALRWEPGETAPGPEHTHVHTGSLATVIAPGDAQVLAGLRAARDAGVSISYDPNIRPTLSPDVAVTRARVEEVVALADVVKASDEDIAYLYPDEDVTRAVILDRAITRWLDLGAGLVVVTEGPDGVRWRTSADRDSTPRLPPAGHTVVDTVGAGDSFMAGLVSGLLDAGWLGQGTAAALRSATSEDVRDSIERGLATSAVTVAHTGAYSPTRAEL
ncbi:carbohydrate kinase family protein [Kribbia dieselivorans]|uniref:carbohydrate kinase family protein n=1 Tax=Kribbia dieselivorans TaxID=331526 RepID=UPI00083869C0|nr:carbohydrate kinase [Kribbia dieselivorans]